jgi:glutathione S-transferase
MILVGQFDSPFVRRVAVTLHHYGMPYTRNTMSVISDAAEMARINPLGRVPSLILDNGEVLIDSNAIADHLEEAAGDRANLLPPAGEERRRVLRVVAASCGVVDKAIAIVYENLFHERQQLSQTWLGRCEGQVASTVRYLESHMTGAWIAGERFSQADIMTGATLSYLTLRLPALFPREAYPQLAALSDRCEALPCFAACRPGANETVPAP